MKVIYKCKCMSAETEIDVPDRRPNSDIGDWMDMVIACITVDHRASNALCQSDKVEYAKIPVDAAGVGVKPTMQ